MRAPRGFLACALAASAALAHAQPYPTKPIRLLVGDPLGRALGQPIVIENRPGAGSSIAAEVAAKAAADGYTILIASPSSISVNPVLNPKIRYNAQTDLAPITLVSASPLVLAVHPSLGVASVRELIDAARKAPGRINFASSGNGAAPHLAAVLFNRVASVDLVHVPYKGGGPAVQSLLAGDTQVMFATPPSVLPQIQAGRLRGLAITSKASSSLLPGLPGMAEAGLPDYEISFWYGFFAPAGTPRPIVNRLFEATAGALQRPEVKEMLAREGTETAVSRSPEDFAAFLAEDAKFWVRLVKESGAKID